MPFKAAGRPHGASPFALARSLARSHPQNLPELALANRTQQKSCWMELGGPRGAGERSTLPPHSAPRLPRSLPRSHMLLAVPGGPARPPSPPRAHLIALSPQAPPPPAARSPARPPAFSPPSAAPYGTPRSPLGSSRHLGPAPGTPPSPSPPPGASTPAASSGVRSARRGCRPARPRCCVSLSSGAAAWTAWKVTWRWDRPAPLTLRPLAESDQKTSAAHLNEEQHVCFRSARSFTLPRLRLAPRLGPRSLG